MADKIPIIKSKRLISQLKPSRFCFQTLIVGLCVLALSICSVLAATCPSSVPPSMEIIVEKCSFTGYASTQTYGIVGGPVSNSLYYLYYLQSPLNNAAVRKVDASGYQTWMASFVFQPILKSLSVDAAEQSVYLASFTSPLVVLKLTAKDGAIISQHQL